MLSSIKQTCGEIGRKEAVLYYLSEILLRASGRHARLIRYYLVAQPVPEASLPPRADPNTEIRQVFPGDPVLDDFPRASDIVATRFARGDICLAAINKGTFAGFLWLAFGAYDEDEVRCRYELAGHDLSWDYDIHIEPRYRMGRTFLRLWDAANQLLRQRSVNWSISRISAFNPASLNSHARLGTRQLGTATFIVLGPVQISFTDGHLPHLSFRHATVPHLRLHAPDA
jgi:hypothetical protein